MRPIIEARDLRKRFGHIDALDGFDLVAQSNRSATGHGGGGRGDRSKARRLRV
jgi:hypothetical protein